MGKELIKEENVTSVIMAICGIGIIVVIAFILALAAACGKV